MGLTKGEKIAATKIGKPRDEATKVKIAETMRVVKQGKKQALMNARELVERGLGSGTIDLKQLQYYLDIVAGGVL